MNTLEWTLILNNCWIESSPSSFHVSLALSSTWKMPWTFWALSGARNNCSVTAGPRHFWKISHSILTVGHKVEQWVKQAFPCPPPHFPRQFQKISQHPPKQCHGAAALCYTSQTCVSPALQICTPLREGQHYTAALARAWVGLFAYCFIMKKHGLLASYKMKKKPQRKQQPGDKKSRSSRKCQLQEMWWV